MYLITSKLLTTSKDKSAFMTDQMSTIFFPASFIQNALKADRYEFWGTNFQDEGKDYTSHKLFNGNLLVDEIKIEGYQ